MRQPFQNDSPRPSASPRARRTRAIRVGLAVFLQAALTLSLDAQYFGRNKVQWEDFDFAVHETPHFRVHYYPEDNQAAIDAARMAERWYARLAPLFGELPEKTPIILYNDQADFRQTTIVSGLIGEGVGGLTEPLRSRLVMPITGIYAETDHVMGHEMVHVFQFATAEALGGRRSGAGLGTLPLYLVEGMAEYLSVGPRDAQTAMFLRDALVEDELPQKRGLERTRLSPYRFGHAFWAYVAGRWGEETVGTLFTAALVEGPERAFQKVLGVESEELWSDWHAAIARDYSDEVARRERPGEQGTPIFPPREKEGGPIDVAPVLSPDGRRVAFLSTRGLFGFDVYVADVESGRIERRLTSTRTDPHFDALRFLDTSGAWSPDGEKLCVVVYAKGDNHLAILDVESGKLERRLRIPGAEALSDPAWSPDGRRLAVSGAERGTTDLYLIDLEADRTVRLTRDPYADLQPTWSPDGRRLAWVTDRGRETELDVLAYGPTRIGLLDVAAGGEISAQSARSARLLDLFEQGDHFNPQFSPDGNTLYFVASPDGVQNVFAQSLADGRIARVTDLHTGVAGITDLSPAFSVAPESGLLAFSTYVNSRYLLYTLDRSATPLTDDLESPGSRVPGASVAAILPPRERPREGSVTAYLNRPEAGLPPPQRDPEASSYRPRLSLLQVGPPVVGAGVDSAYGLGIGGAVSVYFGDMLGRHQLGVGFQGALSSEDDFGSGFAASATYLNRAHRWNWGASVAHVPYVTASTAVGETVIDVDGTPVTADVVQQLRETVELEQAGLLAQYPFSTTSRFETGAFVTRQRISRELETALVLGNSVVDSATEDLASPTDLDLGQGYVAYVHDSSAFAFTSPIAGMRYRLEAGSTAGTLRYQTVLADFRRYVPFRPASFAVRALHFGRYGGDATDDRLAPLYLGRETLVRGYGDDSFSASECTTTVGTSCPEFDRLIGDRIGVVNLELRLQVLGAGDYGLANAPYFPTELAAFFDVGAAWDEDTSVELDFDRESIERVPVASAGLAARVLVAGYLPIEVYAAYPLHRPEEDFIYGFLITPGW